MTAGWRVVEIGCGPGFLAERVGTGGRVTGIERNAEQVDSARRLLAANGLANVEVRCGDGRRATGLPAGSFDLTTARLVLVNVPEPQQIVDEMARLTRPGGVVACTKPSPPPSAWIRPTRRKTGWSRYSRRRRRGRASTATSLSERRACCERRVSRKSK